MREPQIILPDEVLPIKEQRYRIVTLAEWAQTYSIKPYSKALQWASSGKLLGAYQSPLTGQRRTWLLPLSTPVPAPKMGRPETTGAGRKRKDRREIT